MERESLVWKRSLQEVPSWRIGLKLSVELCYLLNRSKQQYPYFQKKGVYDFLHQNNQVENEDDKDRHKNKIKNNNENENRNGNKNYDDKNINKNNCKNDSKVEIKLDRISHSFFPFISVRGHCWRRVLVDLQHLKATNEEIQYIVSIRILIEIRNTFICAIEIQIFIFF